jgi:hypothetical protein
MYLLFRQNVDILSVKPAGMNITATSHLQCKGGGGGGDDYHHHHIAQYPFHS